MSKPIKIAYLITPQRKFKSSILHIVGYKEVICSHECMLRAISSLNKAIK
ncbi:hypothetical protein [Helicobacter trogontum]|nr:hypothetical protein [Helicobacter trogontum]